MVIDVKNDSSFNEPLEISKMVLEKYNFLTILFVLFSIPLTLSLLFTPFNRRIKEDVIGLKGLNNESPGLDMESQTWELKDYTNSLEPFIDRISVRGDLIEVFFFENYEDFLEDNPGTEVSKEDFEYFPGSDFEMENLMITMPLVIMKNMDSINRVYIKINYGEKGFEIKVSRRDLENFIGPDWKNSYFDACLDNENQRQRFVDIFLRELE
jgi:hypothetical protein